MSEEEEEKAQEDKGGRDKDAICKFQKQVCTMLSSLCLQRGQFLQKPQWKPLKCQKMYKWSPTSVEFPFLYVKMHRRTSVFQNKKLISYVSVVSILVYRRQTWVLMQQPIIFFFPQLHHKQMLIGKMRDLIPPPGCSASLGVNKGGRKPATLGFCLHIGESETSFVSISAFDESTESKMQCLDSIVCTVL